MKMRLSRTFKVDAAHKLTTEVFSYDNTSNILQRINDILKAYWKYRIMNHAR